MKLLNFNKFNTLASFYLVMLVFTSFSYTICTSQPDDVTNYKNDPHDLIENLENKIQKKLNLRKLKRITRSKLITKNNTISNQDITEEQIQFMENFKKNHSNNDSFVYASWFIFVPLVLLIFIMTILSIAGFLILILNSTNNTPSTDKKTYLRNQISRLSRNNLFSDQEILEILRMKQHKKVKSKRHSNYKAEPEPEAIILGI